jgi:hypothetical protein
VRDIDESSAPVRLVIAHNIHDAKFHVPQRRFACDRDADFGLIPLRRTINSRADRRADLIGIEWRPTMPPVHSLDRPFT